MSDELTRVYLGHFSDEWFTRTSHHRATNWHQEILVSALDKCIHPAKSMGLYRSPECYLGHIKLVFSHLLNHMHTFTGLHPIGIVYNVRYIIFLT